MIRPGPEVYPYDRVPFRSTAVPNADCRRIEVIARLFGVTTAPCAQARVLELGCGSAANLLPLALAHPGANFVGCDLSQRALALAQLKVDALGLTNVELRHADICDVDEGWASFDYILCHDVFSWVDAGVRQKILAILSRNLAARGVGYISYDTLPAWGLRGIVRDMMRFHAGGIADPRQAVDQARVILALGAAAQDQKAGSYAELMREEYYLFSTISDEHLYHLAFSEHHQPFYFHEFIRLIGEAGLNCLGDADVTRLFGPREPAVVRGFLDALPRLERQQYLDFLMSGACRGALVCHRDVEIRNRPDENVLRDCWISLAAAHRESVASNPPSNPLVQEALSRLEERHPEFVAFTDLGDMADLPERDTPPTALFMEAYAARKIDVALSPPRISGRISAHPTVSPLVLLQAQEGAVVTNQKCETIRLTDLARHVVPLLDGVHSADDVCASVAQEIQAGTLANDWILRLADDTLDAPRLTDNVLRHLRDAALLIA